MTNLQYIILTFSHEFKLVLVYIVMFTLLAIVFIFFMLIYILEIKALTVLEVIYFNSVIKYLAYFEKIHYLTA